MRRSSGNLGGVGVLLAILLSMCAGRAQSAEPPGEEAVESVNAGYDPDIYTRDPWQLGYCVSRENDAAEMYEGEGGYGTGSYAELLAARPCTLDLAFKYGKLLKKHRLVGEEDTGKVWKILADTEPEFRDNVMKFSDGYAENFVNR